MKVLVEAGHGLHYRTPGKSDPGLISDWQYTEASITCKYAFHLSRYLSAHGHPSKVKASGDLSERLRMALWLSRELLLSLHMGLDTTGAPGGRVAYHHEAGAIIARRIAENLGFPAVQVEPTSNLCLLFKPSIEIELGNVACWNEMKTLGSRKRAFEVFELISSALTSLSPSQDPPQR